MMSDTWGIISAVVCVIVCEAVGFVVMKRFSKKGVPYEIPHIPVLLFTFSALYGIKKITFFFPISQVTIEFCMLYCSITAGMLFLLALIRHIHYQSYIFILNWLKR